MFYFLIILVSFCAQAGKHQHKAHAHGAAKIGIAFEGLSGKITFESPGESIFGFEYAAKTEVDKKKQAAALSQLENEISQIVVFENQLKCVFSKESIAVKQDGKHSELEASFTVTCEKDLANTSLIMNVQKTFPKLKNVDVQILVGEIQKSLAANKNGVKIELKK